MCLRRNIIKSHESGEYEEGWYINTIVYYAKQYVQNGILEKIVRAMGKKSKKRGKGK